MNFDKLRKNLVNPVEWNLVAEAVTCYEAKAYRAAYIMAWVACGEVLTRRLDEMANTDGKLGNSLVSYRNDPNDSTLVNLATSCGFTSETEKQQLIAFLQRRHNLAHPNEAQPLPYEVEFIIKFVTKTLLTRPPFLTGKAVNRLAETLVEDPYAVSDNAEDIQKWVERRTQRLQESDHPRFFRTLLHKPVAFTSTFDPSLRLAACFTYLLGTWRPDLGADEWGVETALQMETPPTYFFDLLLTPQNWVLLDTNPELQKTLALHILRRNAHFVLLFPKLVDLWRHLGYAGNGLAELFREWFSQTDFDTLEKLPKAIPFPYTADLFINALNTRFAEPAGYVANILRNAREQDIGALPSNKQIELANALHRSATQGSSYRAEAAATLFIQRTQQRSSEFQNQLYALFPNIPPF